MYINSYADKRNLLSYGICSGYGLAAATEQESVRKSTKERVAANTAEREEAWARGVGSPKAAVSDGSRTVLVTRSGGSCGPKSRSNRPAGRAFRFECLPTRSSRSGIADCSHSRTSIRQQVERRSLAARISCRAGRHARPRAG